jgi:ADP-ribose pyrophosphatase YjhB (NUDIX family)
MAPHIHAQFDFVVSVFIIHKGRVLLVHHKSYDEWLPIGGHIEMDEDPEQALYREIKEECGLRVRILAHKPAINHPGVKALLTPSYMDVHRIDKVHRHIAFVYFGLARSARVRLHEREHKSFVWLKRSELKKKCYRLSKSIRFYCEKAFDAAEHQTEIS